MDPRFLLNLTRKGLVQIMTDFVRLDSRSKRSLCAHVCKRYHILTNVDNPRLAVYELVMRLVYEVMIGKISISDLDSIKWFTAKNRDHRHHMRIVKLMKVIALDSRWVRYMYDIDWIYYFNIAR